MNIAISTGFLALIRPQRLLADWYSVSVFQSAGFTQPRLPLPASGWQSAREGCGGIDLPAWAGLRCVD
jgi:hypothetical protein